MPDLVTHLTLAYFLKKPASWSRHRLSFFLGAILPDLLSRPFYIFFPASYSVVYTIHTPFAVAVFCLLLALFFEPDIRRGVRLNLLLGAGSHFSLDLLQKSVTVSYYWLYPFSLNSFSIGLIWPEDSLWLVPLWVVLVAAAEAASYVRKKNRAIAA